MSQDTYFDCSTGGHAWCLQDKETARGYEFGQAQVLHTEHWHCRMCGGYKHVRIVIPIGLQRGKPTYWCEHEPVKDGPRKEPQ